MIEDTQSWGTTGAEYGRQGEQVTWTTESLQRDFDVLAFSYGMVVVVRKVDGVKLVTGGSAFTDDIQLPGMLYGKILPSPHAHARIKRIDAGKAKALAGVHAVLTYKDVPRVPHTTAGQAWPEPSPYDTYLLDSKVRFVGDRVAAVAAESRAKIGRAHV